MRRLIALAVLSLVIGVVTGSAPSSRVLGAPQPSRVLVFEDGSGLRLTIQPSRPRERAQSANVTFEGPVDLVSASGTSTRLTARLQAHLDAPHHMAEATLTGPALARRRPQHDERPCVLPLRERRLEALVQRHAVILVVTLVLFAGCAPTAGVDLPVSALRAEPASEVAPPGAVVLRTVQAEPFNNITGHEAAFYGHLFGVGASAADIHAFYDRELARLVWRVTRPPILGTIETDGWAWCKPKLLFSLSILDPRGYSRIPLAGAEQYQTVFDARLAGTDEGCPTG